MTRQYCSIRVALLLLVPLFQTLRAQAVEATLPVPPSQGLPWVAPTGLFGPEVISSIDLLFREGLADPRACEYRHIWIKILDKKTNESEVATDGWVIPSTTGSQFGVAWNGLVYPLAKVGETADLAADVATMVSKFTEEDPYYLGSYDSEYQSISADRLRYSRYALLMRLGRGDLARKVWDALFLFDKGNEPRAPYYLIADEWARALYERALEAEYRSNIPDAILVCTQLLLIKTDLESNFSKRNIAPPYFTYLGQLRLFLGDLKRRTRESPQELAIKDIRSLPRSGPARIAGLIFDLQDCASENDPAAAALLLAGDDAVGPLIACLEHDTRFGLADLGRNRAIPIRDLAYKLIKAILNTQFYDSDIYDELSTLSQPTQEQVISDVRAYWHSAQGVPVPERWYKVLQGDDVGVEQWVQSADKIIAPTSPNKALSSPFSGEVLRQKSGPSVSDLLRKRIEGLHTAQIGFDRELIQKNHLATDLGAWDAKNNLDELKQVCVPLEKYLKLPQDQDFVDPLEQLLKQRIDGGDDSALPEYSAWVSTLQVDPLWSPGFTENVTWIMRQNSKDAVMETLAQKLLVPGSEWLSFLRNDGFAYPEYFMAPIAQMKAFREEILHGLADQTIVGSLKFGADGIVQLEMIAPQSTLVDFDPEKLPRPGSSDAQPPGTVCSIRRCDMYAFLLQIPGAPSCRLYWPQKKKDLAVQKAIALLLQKQS